MSLDANGIEPSSPVGSKAARLASLDGIAPKAPFILRDNVVRQRTKSCRTTCRTTKSHGAFILVVRRCRTTLSYDKPSDKMDSSKENRFFNGVKASN